MLRPASKSARSSISAICFIATVGFWMLVPFSVRGQTAPPKPSRRTEAIRREIEILKAKLALKEAELQVVEARERLRGLVAEAASSARPEAKGEADSGPRGEEKTKETADKGSSRDRAIREELARKIVLPFPDKTPFEEVLRFIKTATESSTLPGGVPIYVEPKGLDDPEGTMKKPVTLQPDRLPLERSLDEIARQVGLSWRIERGLLMFEARAGDREQRGGKDGGEEKEPTGSR